MNNLFDETTKGGVNDGSDLPYEASASSQKPQRPMLASQGTSQQSVKFDASCDGGDNITCKPGPYGHTFERGF